MTREAAKAKKRGWHRTVVQSSSSNCWLAAPPRLGDKMAAGGLKDFLRLSRASRAGDMRLLGAIGIGYPFSLLPVAGFKKWIIAADVFPLGPCRSKRDPVYSTAGGVSF